MPVAPLSLASGSTAATAAMARSRRAATLANSLPRVVGLAGWPWVRDSMGWSACAAAISVSLAAISRRRGTSTRSRARVSMSACEVLLMSSEVQAKWMNSAARASSASSATFSLSQYSTAFTSWFVTRSISLMRAASASEKCWTSESRCLRAAAEGRQLGQAGVGKRDEPGHLDLDAVRHEARLRQQAAQRVAAGSVAAIQWRKSVELAELVGDLHGSGRGVWREKAVGRGKPDDFIIRGGPTLWQTG
ncbi:hypothetical protein AD428_13765 [Achromobacter sp. DMS1]|nr:hypothetical protein AD428_13765 [Achromobacter sp. DMS1]